MRKHRPGIAYPAPPAGLKRLKVFRLIRRPASRACASEADAVSLPTESAIAALMNSTGRMHQKRKTREAARFTRTLPLAQDRRVGGDKLVLSLDSQRRASVRAPHSVSSRPGPVDGEQVATARLRYGRRFSSSRSDGLRSLRKSIVIAWAFVYNATARGGEFEARSPGL